MFDHWMVKDLGDYIHTYIPRIISMKATVNSKNYSGIQILSDV
jgi:hypothetical protein